VLETSLGINAKALKYLQASLPSVWLGIYGLESTSKLCMKESAGCNLYWFFNFVACVTLQISTTPTLQVLSKRYN
jgi:hypothetical protein